MKLTALLAAPLLAVSLASQAEPTDYCGDLYDFAESTMRLRQAGTPMPLMIETAAGNELALNITEEAYLHPRLRVPENQQRATQDFANKIYSQCLSARRNRQ